MLCTEPRSTDARSTCPENAWSPIVLTVSVSVTDFRSLEIVDLNAWSWIPVTVYMVPL